MALQARKRQQIEQGKAHIRKAQEHESTGWFKWTPEWTLAASEYEKAGSMFKMAQDYDNAKRAYFHQSKAQAELKIFFSAGQALEKASGMAKEGGNIDEAADLMARASTYYSQDGKYHKAADALGKAAKLVIHDANRCLDYFAQAVDIIENDDDLMKLGSDILKMGQTLYVQHQKLAELTAYLHKLVGIYFQLKQRHNIHKTFMSLVIVGLASDDFVAAEAAYKEACSSPHSCGFCSTDDAKVCIKLLHAFESGSVEELEKVAKLQCFTFLHASIFKLVKQLIADAKSEKLETFGLQSGGSKFSSAGIEIVPFPVDILSKDDLKSEASDSDNRKKFLNIDTNAPFNPNNLSTAETPLPATSSSDSNASSSSSASAASSASSSSSPQRTSSSRLAAFYKDQAAKEEPQTPEKKEALFEQEPKENEPLLSNEDQHVPLFPNPTEQPPQGNDDELFGKDFSDDLPAVSAPPSTPATNLDEVL
mmetsp:Transcript_19420/g.30420  ORF Transcript_19420/g.30420 Transcript_19420/m.30420 type:complete len:479 (-) Transcript_19420:118-1554(-)